MAKVGVRTATDLHRVTGINRSTISLKMAGTRRWQLADLQKIAAALDTTVSYLLGETADPAREAQTAGALSLDRAELARRLNVLGEGQSKLLSGDNDPIDAPRAQLEAIAVARNVPTGYLTDFSDAGEADRVEALIEFTRAAESSGVQRIAARALGALSAEELRALAKAISSGAS